MALDRGTGARQTSGGARPKPQRVNDPIIAKVWKAAGFKGTVPPVFSKTQRPGVAGSQPIYRRNVAIDPKVIANLRRFPLTPGDPRAIGAIGTLLHEFAHTKQPRVFSRPRMEGGAAAKVHLQLPELLKALNAGPAAINTARKMPIHYPRESSKLWLTRGSVPFVQRGQYGKRV